MYKLVNKWVTKSWVSQLQDQVWQLFLDPLRHGLVHLGAHERAGLLNYCLHDRIHVLQHFFLVGFLLSVP